MNTPNHESRSQQLQLDWNAAPVPTVEPVASQRDAIVLPRHQKPLPALPKRTLRDTVERFLRERGTPYINVDEAKRALFAGAKLRSFHFVVYRTTGCNWLLFAATLRKESREDLRQWQDIFGTGFVAVVATRTANDTLRFRTLTGESIELA